MPMQSISVGFGAYSTYEYSANTSDLGLPLLSARLTVVPHPHKVAHRTVPNCTLGQCM